MQNWTAPTERKKKNNKKQTRDSWVLTWDTSWRYSIHSNTSTMWVSHIPLACSNTSAIRCSEIYFLGIWWAKNTSKDVFGFMFLKKGNIFPAGEVAGLWWSFLIVGYTANAFGKTGNPFFFFFQVNREPYLYWGILLENAVNFTVLKSRYCNTL